jgi:hypothetical protein
MAALTFLRFVCVLAVYFIRAAPRFWRCSFDRFMKELYFSAMFAKLRSEISVVECIALEFSVCTVLQS